MNQLIAVACIAFGGAAGSVMRYAFGQWMYARVGPGYPWGTFLINVTGAFAIGVVLQAAGTRAGLNPYLRLFLATGVLGGFTTFSTFAYETVALSIDAFSWQSVAYAISSVVCGVGAVLAGIMLVRLGL